MTEIANSTFDTLIFRLDFNIYRTATININLLLNFLGHPNKEICHFASMCSWVFSLIDKKAHNTHNSSLNIVSNRCLYWRTGHCMFFLWPLKSTKPQRKGKMPANCWQKGPLIGWYMGGIIQKQMRTRGLFHEQAYWKEWPATLSYRWQLYIPLRIVFALHKRYRPYFKGRRSTVSAFSKMCLIIQSALNCKSIIHVCLRPVCDWISDTITILLTEMSW